MRSLFKNNENAEAMASSSGAVNTDTHPEINGDGSDDFMIKPESLKPALDTSRWPLLLKNYDKYACLRSCSECWCCVMI